MIANNIKKQIINDWSNEYTYLSVYTQNKLYKLLGPFVIGIEILNLPRTENYRPVFVCYPLWKSDIGQCLEEPVFIQEIYNKKGLQFDIPYTKHNNAFFQEAIECIRKQVPILSQQNISLQQLFGVIDKQFSQILIKSSPVGQAKLFEGKILGSLYVNDPNTIKKVLEEINQISKAWIPNLFEWKYGKLDSWFQNLQIIISNRDNVLKQIGINKQVKKMAQLQSSELMPL
jgi:hypothetical protein